MGSLIATRNDFKWLALSQSIDFMRKTETMFDSFLKRISFSLWKNLSLSVLVCRWAELEQKEIGEQRQHSVYKQIRCRQIDRILHTLPVRERRCYIKKPKKEKKILLLFWFSLLRSAAAHGSMRIDSTQHAR